MSGPGNGGPVTWGRYDAEHQEVLRRLTIGEAQIEALRAGVSAHDALLARVARLEDKSAGRLNRIWMIGAAVLTGLICPVVVTMIITLAHLRG